MTVFQKLSAPFATVHWRAQSMNREGTSAMALAYIDARDVMARLDDVVGPQNWRDSYVETVKGRLICTLELRIDGEWISKADGAGNTDVEGDKGAISDALKRAAVKWGIGRYLYDMETPWADCTSYEKNGKKMWKAWTPAGLAKLQKIAASVGAKQSHVEPTPELPDSIHEADRAQILTLSQAAGVSLQSIVEGYKVSALDELTGEQAAKTLKALRKRLTEQQQKEAA